MDKIIIDSLKIFAHHGVNPEETAMGQWFVLDIEAWTDLSDACLTDELDEQILMLKHYAGIDDKQHLMAKIAECRSLLFEIVRDDNIALHNIF